MDEISAWGTGMAGLWGLGDRFGSQPSSVVGLGGEGDAQGLVEAVASGARAGAVILASGEGPASGSLPARRTVSGVASFDGGTKVEGDFTVFDADGDSAAVRSDLGVHAVRIGDVLVVGYDPEREWGRIDSFWVPEIVGAFLEGHLGRLDRLPPIGILRLDDTPGTAQHQMQGRGTDDRRQHRRIARTVDRLRSAGSVLNVAIAAEALDDAGERVPLDRVWPKSIAAWERGIRLGVVEPVCHGLLHLDTEAFERGEVEFREFARLDAAEAGDRIDRALAWQEEHLARPATFAAPAWAYGEAGDAEGAARGLVRWHRARPGPMLEDGRLHESLLGALPGLHDLDFSPLQRLAAAGIPPMVAMHGGLLDSRMQTLKERREPLPLIRLFLKRDMARLIDLGGIEWLGAADLVRRLSEHREPAES